MTVNETYKSQFGLEDIVVERNNSLTAGYVPVIRELEGVSYIVQGVANTLFGALAPMTNEPLSIRGKAQISDGLINLGASPIVWFALGFAANEWKR